MAERKPVVLVGGVLKEMPSGDALPAANIPEVTATNIHAAPSKSTPVDADELGLSDSAASWGLKKLTFANLKAVLLAYFKGQFREKLTAARTYYVRTDGSDSNDGLANTSGGAFLTIQKAVDTVASIDTAIYSVTISVGAGTFGAVILKDAMGAGSQWLTGAGAGSTIIETTSAHCLQCGTSRKWVVQNLTLQNSGGTSRCVLAAPGSAVTLSSVDFGPCAAYHMDASGGAVTLGNYTVSGGGMIHWYTANGGQIICAGFSVTFSGTPTFSSAVAHCDVASFQRLNSTTFTGAVNGKRYNVLNGGVIYTAGAGETFLPGSTAGTVGPGGQYA